MINYVNINCNYKFANLSVQVTNGSLINARFEVFTAIKRLNIQMKINVPADKDDKNFQKEVFRNSIDYKRLLEGARGNYVIQVLVDNFFKSLDFEPKLPMMPVSLN